MVYKIGWHQDKRVIFGYFKGDVSVDDLNGWTRQIENMVKTGIAPVHLIVDLEHLGRFPNNITLTKNMISYLRNPKTGWNVTIQASMLASTIAQIIAEKSFRNVQTLEEAVDFLHEQDPTLAQK